MTLFRCRQAASDMSSLFIPVCEPVSVGNPHAALPYNGGGKEYWSRSGSRPGTLHWTGWEHRKSWKHKWSFYFYSFRFYFFTVNIFILVWEIAKLQVIIFFLARIKQVIRPSVEILLSIYSSSLFFNFCFVGILPLLNSWQKGNVGLANGIPSRNQTVTWLRLLDHKDANLFPFL